MQWSIEEQTIPAAQLSATGKPEPSKTVASVSFRVENSSSHLVHMDLNDGSGGGTTVTFDRNGGFVSAVDIAPPTVDAPEGPSSSPPEVTHHSGKKK